MNGAREANRHFLPKLPRHHLADPNKSQPIRWSDLMRPGRLIGLLLGPEPDPVEVAQLREKLAKEELPEIDPEAGDRPSLPRKPSGRE